MDHNSRESERVAWPGHGVWAIGYDLYLFIPKQIETAQPQPWRTGGRGAVGPSRLGASVTIETDCGGVNSPPFSLTSSPIIRPVLPLAHAVR
jgi:hypothetical protein